MGSVFESLIVFLGEVIEKRLLGVLVEFDGDDGKWSGWLG